MNRGGEGAATANVVAISESFQIIVGVVYYYKECFTSIDVSFLDFASLLAILYACESADQQISRGTKVKTL